MAQSLENIMAIKAIVYDIDGVLTNGMIVVAGTSPDDLLRMVSVKDSFASRAAALKGYILGVISGAAGAPLRSRLAQMGVDDDNIYMGTRGKLATFQTFCQKHGLQPHEVAYFGDDIPDTQVLRACGLGFAPADAADEAKEAADYVCTRPGGYGCLREGIELIMKAQDKWHFDEDKFHQIY